jgi:hypothetical protein
MVEAIRALSQAVREGRTSVVVFAVGLAATVVLNLLGALAAPSYLRNWLYAAGAASAVVTAVGFALALLDGHHVRVRLGHAESRIAELEDDAATPTWLKLQRDEEAMVAAMMGPAPSAPEGTPHPL